MDIRQLTSHGSSPKKAGYGAVAEYYMPSRRYVYSRNEALEERTGRWLLWQNRNL